MNNSAELDIRDWIPEYLTPTYKLNTSEKEKRAIGATATRPEALIESDSARGSNKALSYKHITLLKARDEGRSSIFAIVDLIHIKNSREKGKRKKFIFHLESISAFCIVSHLLAIAFDDDAFASNVTSIEDIFHLEINSNCKVAKLRFKKEKYNLPILHSLSQDKRAPTELTEDQKLEVRNHPELVKLREERDQYRVKIYRNQYDNIEAAEGTKLFSRYKTTECKINNMSIKLRRERLDRALQDFHDSIDTIEINKQLNGSATADVLISSTVQYELRERAAIMKLLSQQLDELDEENVLKIRTVFICNLAKLC
ncbi:MAG: hypothetical protein M1813_002792 [Trichoglossum hirsutum]|nr:MAG: hypothetical protein M1813_002792 [Trichoglossum hirsutum]